LIVLTGIFIASGSLFSRSSPPIATPALNPEPSAPDAGHVSADQISFSSGLFSVEEVHRALLSQDTTKSVGPDRLEPYFLKLAKRQCLFKLTLTANSIPEIWKVANVLPLLKGGTLPA